MTFAHRIAWLASCSAAALLSSQAAFATDFNVPGGDLRAALESYKAQSGVSLFVLTDTVKGVHTAGVKGDLPADEALSRILKGTGFVTHRDPSGVIAVVREQSSQAAGDGALEAMHLAQASPPQRAAVETVTVTSSKLGGADVQSIPIAITALSQEQLTSRQIAGGPDLVKEVPNLTFTKTNFTGYSIQIRGIGTQAISVTTDPAVAVAFNDTPFIRNHFFEQEFYDVSQVEVLRGPQGTLYGRNATAGVVNVISAKPTDQFEAVASADIGNYHNRRYEGMINIPVVDDRFDLRVAGEWTKRDGYSFNETTGKPIDGRDLWSSRVTLGFKPTENLQSYLVWEHFQENDDRVRSAKQLCKKDPGPSSVDGLDLNTIDVVTEGVHHQAPYFHALLSQGCLPASFYSADAYETPNGLSIPFVFFGAFIANVGGSDGSYMLKQVDPYASNVQSRNLRVIQSALSPTYKAKNDVIELNTDYHVTPTLTLTSQTGYSRDQLGSTEDFNRFNTTPGIFNNVRGTGYLDQPDLVTNGVYCDPQMGCSSKMVGEDLSREHAWQFNQEFRLASNFQGPLNFSLGANYSHYETVEDYFVFFNIVSMLTQMGNGEGAGDFTHCYTGGRDPSDPSTTVFYLQPFPYKDIQHFGSVTLQGTYPSIFGCSSSLQEPGTYIDPNPVSSLDGNGHNYFRSENPYRLNSYAGFGEAYYQVLPEVKLTAGLRWTDDNKTFWDIPSWAFLEGGGYPVTGIVNQQWKEWTGRFVADWTPKLDFTDQTLIYASYSRGYKGGGANPPRPAVDITGDQGTVAHPATFAPEFIDAYELGTKDTLLDGAVTMNGDVFYYDYKGYQISQIVDRTSINLNFDAKVSGAELESTWEPLPGLRFNFAGGYETSSVDKGQSAIDLIDRTAGNPDYFVVKPYVTDTSNCILPAAILRQWIETQAGNLEGACEISYNRGTYADYGITGFDPSTVPNNGEGVSKDVSGNQLPNTPHFTTSLGAEYTMPISEDWAATLHSDFYWQSQSYARIFNDRPYDKLRGYSNVNLALILTSVSGWQVMGYLKNVFDTTAITGAFLNSDDTALTTNVFVTDPRLFGLRINKNW